MLNIGIQAHTLTLTMLLATLCAFEWCSNLKIGRVMLILKFDLLFDFVNYIFDIWPQINDISMWRAIRSVMISQKLRPVSVNSDTLLVHLNMNIEGWDSEVTLWRNCSPDQCQKYFFLGNFCWPFRILGHNSHIWQSLSLRDWRWKAAVTLGWMGAAFNGSGSWPHGVPPSPPGWWEYRWCGKFTWIAAL